MPANPVDRDQPGEPATGPQWQGHGAVSGRRTKEDPVMNIGNFCRRHIVTIDSAGTPAEAACLMRDHHVGALVVTRDAPEGAHIAGIVTDRDLVIGVLAQGAHASIATVEQLATHKLVTVPESADLTAAIAAMREHGVRRLLVTDGDRMTGFVSLDDVIDACAMDLQGIAAVLRSGIEREVAHAAAAPAEPPRVVRIPAMGTVAWGNR